MVILISGLLCLPSCRYFENLGLFKGRSLKKALLWARQDSTRVADSLKKIEISKKTKAEPVQNSAVKDADGKPAVESKSSKYYIIVGSFSSLENAKIRARDYSSRGYKTAIIESTNRKGTKAKLVSARTFEDLNAAKAFIKGFQHDVDPTAWIYQGN